MSKSKIKIIFISLLFFYPFNTYAQGIKSDTITFVINKHYFLSKKIKIVGQYYSNKQKNGLWIYYNRKGKVKSKGNYVNNVKVGFWIVDFHAYKFDEKGKIIGKGTYIEGDW